MKHRKAHTVFPVVYLMKDSPDILIISRLWNKADRPPKAVSERMRAVFIFVEISMPYNIGTPLPISRYADMMVYASPEKYLHIRFPVMANMTMYTPITVILCTELLIMSEYEPSGFSEFGLWWSGDVWVVAAVSSSVEVLERWDDIHDRVSAMAV